MCQKQKYLCEKARVGGGFTTFLKYIRTVQREIYEVRSSVNCTHAKKKMETSKNNNIICYALILHVCKYTGRIDICNDYHIAIMQMRIQNTSCHHHRQPLFHP